MNTNGANYDYSVSVFIAAMGMPSPIEPSAAKVAAPGGLIICRLTF